MMIGNMFTPNRGQSLGAFSSSIGQNNHHHPRNITTRNAVTSHGTLNEMKHQVDIANQSALASTQGSAGIRKSLDPESGANHGRYRNKSFAQFDQRQKRLMGVQTTTTGTLPNSLAKKEENNRLESPKSLILGASSLAVKPYGNKP